MKVLFLHNKYLISGGEDVSTRSEIDLLSAHGHDVDLYEVSNESLTNSAKINIAFNTVWSSSSYKAIDRLLKNKKYDIIHVQNFFPQISPSVFYAAKKHNVKTVMSVRNYRLVCPNALMFQNGSICDACVGKIVPYPALMKKCYKESFAATAVVVTMLSTHNFMNTWSNKIDGLIAISDFVKSQLVLGGIRQEKIFVKHNFVNNAPTFHNTGEKEFLYVGRLSEEKGISLLLEAFKNPLLKDVQLRIVGDGPKINEVLNAAERFSNIQYLGRLNINDTYTEMRQSRALIFPSQWHEPFGRTIVESFAAGTPVIAAAVGGVTELVEHRVNGLLYSANSIDDLIKNVLVMSQDIDYTGMRIEARLAYEREFTPKVNYEKIMKIYHQILQSS